ncbi:hypothetical protein ACHAPT_009824 [Fusarium lateritium]
MQTPTRDLDEEFEDYLAFLEQQDQEDQEDDSLYRYGICPPPLETPYLDQLLRDDQDTSYSQLTTLLEPPQFIRQVLSDTHNTDTAVRHPATQQSLSQVDGPSVGGVRNTDSTARQLSAQRRVQPERQQRSPLTQQGQRDVGNPQTATRSQPRLQQASLSHDRRSGNNAQGPRTTGGQLPAQRQQQLGRGTVSHARSTGSTSKQPLVQQQSRLDKQGTSNGQTVVATRGQTPAPKQRLDRGGANNGHLPRAIQQPSAPQDRTQRRDASHGQNGGGDTPQGQPPTPQQQQGQLKRKQPGQDQPHLPQRRVRQQVPGPMAPPPRPKINVDDFPEVPKVEKIQRHLRVTYKGMEVAESSDGFWVLQQYRPPEYYLPKSSLKVLLTPTGYGPPCRHKGHTMHYSVKGPDGILLANRVWSYERPKPGYEVLKDYVSFYARPWQSFVDGERVVPYRTDFRGGWVTAEITGVMSEFTPRF